MSQNDFESLFETPAGNADRKWSINQLCVFARVQAGERNLLVRARAGCGKSTTIEEAVRRVPGHLSVAVVAFGKDIATEMKGRLGGLANVEVLTTHSFGLRQLGSKVNGGRRPVIDQFKVKGILREMTREIPAPRGTSLAGVAKLVGLAKNHAVIGTAPDARVRMVDLAVRFDVELGPTEVWDDAISMAIKALQKSSADPRVVDFDDMIYIPAVTAGVRIWAFDRVFVDETQDLNEAQLALIARMIRPGSGRLIAVGDDRQAIYGFRGAAEGAIDRIVEKFKCQGIPLTTTYRCAKKIVEVAKAHVPDYEAGPNNPEGVVRTIPYEKLTSELTDGDFVVSRSNAPVVKLLLALYSQGRKARMLGRDVGAQWIDMIKKSDAATPAGLICWLRSEWAPKRVEVRTAKDAEADVSDIYDTVEAFEALAEGVSDLASLTIRIESLFQDGADPAKRITLASTHKAKGLEAHRVFVLDWTYQPKKGQRMSLEASNLRYVAVTRAKDELVLVQAPLTAK